MKDRFKVKYKLFQDFEEIGLNNRRIFKDFLIVRLFFH